MIQYSGTAPRIADADFAERGIQQGLAAIAVLELALDDDAAIGIADSAQHLTGGHFHRFSALRSGLPLPVEKLALPKGLII